MQWYLRKRKWNYHVVILLRSVICTTCKLRTFIATCNYDNRNLHSRKHHRCPMQILLRTKHCALRNITTKVAPTFFVAILHYCTNWNATTVCQRLIFIHENLDEFSRVLSKQNACFVCNPPKNTQTHRKNCVKSRNCRAKTLKKKPLFDIIHK